MGGSGLDRRQKLVWRDTVKPRIFLEGGLRLVPEVGREISAAPRSFSYLSVVTWKRGLASTVALLRRARSKIYSRFKCLVPLQDLFFVSSAVITRLIIIVGTFDGKRPTKGEYCWACKCVLFKHLPLLFPYFYSIRSLFIFHFGPTLFHNGDAGIILAFSLNQSETICALLISAINIFQ